MSRAVVPDRIAVPLTTAVLLGVVAGFVIGPAGRKATVASLHPPTSVGHAVAHGFPTTTIALPPGCVVLRPIVSKAAPSFIAGTDGGLIARIGALLPEAVQIVGNIRRIRALVPAESDGVLIIPYSEKVALDAMSAPLTPVVFINDGTVDVTATKPPAYQAVVLELPGPSPKDAQLSGSEAYVARLITNGSAGICPQPPLIEGVSS